MQDQPTTAAGEWRAHWPLVFSATLGMSLGPSTVYALGLFMAPLQQAFGWSRAEVSSGLLIFALIGTPLSPFAGAIVDRWGTRRLVLPGVILTTFAILAFSFATPSKLLWWGLWALYTVATLTVTPVAWTAAVSSVFKVGRGLALAITFCGIAIASLGGPLICRWAIDNHGWRAAFVILGLSWGGVVFLTTAFLFRDARARRSRSMSKAEQKASEAGDAAATAALPGLTFQETLRSSVFWKLFVAQTVFITLSAGMLIHMIPILIDKGMTSTKAAYVFSAYGIAAIVGKVAAGWLLDRTRGPLAPALIVAFMCVSWIALLVGGDSVLIATVAVGVLGFSGGANLACGSYMTTRYIGLRAYGKVYGLLTSIQSIATGVGPWVAGAVYDHYHGYGVLLTAAIPLTLLSALLIALLGAYPQLQGAPAKAA